jgi:protocatechuate 3,4-dioxygenase beta subunit
MNTSKPTRRHLIENCITKGLLVAGAASLSQTQLLAFWEQGEAQANKATSAEVLGPFYRKGAPNNTNLRVSGEPGFPLRVDGKVTNTRGQKVQGVRIDIWQADHVGLYDVQGYRYRTKLEVDTASEYAIETILPGHYDDRPAQHIHYMISAPGHKTLITQAYFATDPFFEGDPIKNHKKRGMVSSPELIRNVNLFEGPGQPRASIQFDICLEKL